MTRIRAYEWLAGKLLVRSALLRAARMLPEDAHELRHLWAALNSGNSDGCAEGSACILDRDALSQFSEHYPRIYGSAPPE